MHETIAATTAAHIQLAALGTANLITWIKNNIISLVVIIAGVSILSGAHKKDFGSASVKVAIVLLGLGVIGAATNSFGIGTQIASLVGAS